MTASTTAERVLDIAQDMVQSRGYNGFSFRDIATALGIKSASIHYHFPSKTDLGAALVIRYSEGFADELRRIEARETGAVKRLRAFIELFRGTLKNDRHCLCGMLGAEKDSLPPPVSKRVRDFFALCEDWLVTVLRDGRKAGEIEFRGPPQAMADHLLALLEGAMVMARSLEDLGRFDKATAAFLRILQPARNA